MFSKFIIATIALRTNATKISFGNTNPNYPYLASTNSRQQEDDDYTSEEDTIRQLELEIRLLKYDIQMKEAKLEETQQELDRANYLNYVYETAEEACVRDDQTSYIQFLEYDLA